MNHEPDTLAMRKSGFRLAKAIDGATIGITDQRDLIGRLSYEFHQQGRHARHRKGWDVVGLFLLISRVGATAGKILVGIPKRFFLHPPRTTQGFDVFESSQAGI
jgi:hypothetical protein